MSIGTGPAGLSAPLRLYCLPHAGASASIYLRWQRALPDWLSVQPVELPGRGRRSSESSMTHFGALVRRLVCETELVPPYALFGHSMGAVLAFELARCASAQGKAPLALCVSGTTPSFRGRSIVDLDARDDGSLLSELRRLGGTRPEVFEHPELRELALSVFRADVALCRSYRRSEGALLGCPVHVFAGELDRPEPEALREWQEHASRPITLDVFPGGHFFVQSQEAQVLARLTRHLSLAREPAACSARLPAALRSSG
jgi:surfactin synthase thioesterase subunit